ncbi:MAG: iron hydrogenase small subunit, partial [Clostridia bacterium]|nr:iron hydrogenase small subunit [Clostridia bacterium]
EEGYELLARLAAQAVRAGSLTPEQAERLGLPSPLPEPVFPMITSCSPGWIKFVEHRYPDRLAHLSSCKSPHMMLGALAKSWFAEKQGIRPADMHVTSIMPCTAKKYEITRPEMKNEGLPNVDAVLTTRELGRLIREAGIDFACLPDARFDAPLGLSTGAADIFGTTGGVMEAALRTVYELLTGREIPFSGLHVAPLVGLDRLKTAKVSLIGLKSEWSFLEGVELRVAVTNGLAGAAAVMDEIEGGGSPYHFIEVMGCPGGCISGGGQPRTADPDVRRLRMEAIYREDEGKPMRKSHENPDVASLYKQFLGTPGSHIAHEYFHTHYTPRNRI